MRRIGHWADKVEGLTFDMLVSELDDFKNYPENGFVGLSAKEHRVEKVEVDGNIYIEVSVTFFLGKSFMVDNSYFPVVTIDTIMVFTEEGANPGV